ncbi:hypothetical protein F2981_24210 (plasmid) [Sinorhizobium meliloti]|nr:hypothetical protein [Sinorhizobium meliloti]
MLAFRPPSLPSSPYLRAAWLILHQTAFGRQVYAVGGDTEAARKAGLPVARIVLFCFIIAGLCAGIGGFVSITQIGGSRPKYGDQIEFRQRRGGRSRGRLALWRTGQRDWQPCSGRSSCRPCRTA